MNILKIFLLVLVLTSCSVKNTSKTKETYNNSKLQSGTLNYQIPNSWQRTQPSSSMRVDELIIDPTTQAKLAVFIFPAIPELVSSNTERWSKQFKDGAQNTKLEQFNLNGLPVSVYSAEGTFLETTNPMDPFSEKLERPDFKLLAAIVELQDGAWFFKTTGPKQVIDSQKNNFDFLLNSIRTP